MRRRPKISDAGGPAKWPNIGPGQPSWLPGISTSTSTYKFTVLAVSDVIGRQISLLLNTMGQSGGCRIAKTERNTKHTGAIHGTWL